MRDSLKKRGYLRTCTAF